MMLKQIGYILILVLSLQSCVKDNITIDENTEIPGLTPSLAIPIADAFMTLEDADEIANSEIVSYNPNTGLYEYELNRDLFNFSADNFFELESQTLTDSYSLDPVSSNAINAGSVGDVLIPDPVDLTFDLELNNGEQLDSILIDEGSFNLVISSTIKHNFLFNLEIPSLKNNGVPFATTFNLTYPGMIPFDFPINMDIDGYVLDLTDGGVSDNQIKVNAQIILTHTGTSTGAADAITGSLDLQIDEFDSVWGYLGQYTQILSVDSNDVNFFDDLNGGILHLADPRIELFVENTSGIDVEIDFTSIIAPGSGGQVILGGTHLSDVPLVTGATSPGDTSITFHTIDNSGTSPTLSDAIDSDPEILIYNASGMTNPNGVSQNFLLDTSRVWSYANIILPAFGYADNFTLTDTIDADIEEIIFEANSSGDVVTYEDVEDFLIRLYIENGLPVQAGIKAYFADSNFVVIDSVFMQNDYQFIVEAGFVDFSLSPNDPDFGRVQQASESLTDISFTQSQIQNLIDNKATKMILQGIGFTPDGSDQEVVKFFPEDEIRVKVSAKIDFNFDLSE